MKENIQHFDLDWETYKWLSRNTLSEKELDVYYFLTYYYLEKERDLPFSESLENLINSALDEEIIADEHTIKAYIKKFDAKKSLF